MYGNSHAYPSSSFNHSEEGELQKKTEIMDPDLHHHQQQQQQQQQPLHSGLMRYRSAPSSLIANFVDGVEGSEDFLHPRSSSPEAETMFARFMSPDPREIEEKSLATTAAINHRNSQFISSTMEHEATQMIYQTPPPQQQQQQQQQHQHQPHHSSTAMENSYRVVNSVAMEHQPQLKTSSSNCSNLIRHSSSPAGLFSNLTVENGYAVIRGMRGTNGEAVPATSRFKDSINFSPGPTSSSGLISQISEIESDSIDPTSPDDGSLGNSSGNNRCYIPGFPIGSSWDDSSIVSENFAGLKRARDVNGKMIPGFNPSETQNGETGNQNPGLTHHFSLPKTSNEMAAIEKFFQFQDSVPCKIRAKRGCATHPRSIAERVRRTRISERMRKLQELVPNMDKQTNTADMLDLSVEYIRELQKQVKTLTDDRANCTCSRKQKSYSKPSV